MPHASIIPEVDEAEAALTRLCKAIQRKVSNEEMRKEYHTLMNQATNALNNVRSFAETSDFLSGFGGSSAGNSRVS